MRIVMFTNTYTPIVGGLERSVMSFAAAFRQRGHPVLIVAPTFADMPRNEEHVLRVPALHHVTRNDFSMNWPLPRRLQRQLQQFRPHVLHAHHPFLLGNTALRWAQARQLPLVFTHHIFFEQYAHYLKPLPSARAQRFLAELATGYANLCDHVFAPSDSIARHLRGCGVQTPITVVPTGVQVQQFAHGQRKAYRAALGIPPDAFVVGHVGRLALEKNLDFLGQALRAFLRSAPQAHALVVGDGPSREHLEGLFAEARLAARVHFAGALPHRQLVDAYHAMDAFAFASTSETQGLVLIEAMAAGTPVVALDASGVREVVRDEVNGRLLYGALVPAFANALQWVARRSAGERDKLRAAARATAGTFSMARCASRALAAYDRVCAQPRQRSIRELSAWQRLVRTLQTQRRVLKTFTRATRAALGPAAQS